MPKVLFIFAFNIVFLAFQLQITKAQLQKADNDTKTDLAETETALKSQVCIRRDIFRTVNIIMSL